ncbi:ATP-binding cassette domain-containing protein [Fontisubflavum oceani]|uniref:ATP-binding cassette domain-containing protein n=1 Tax=Fontisubflavum oceani TaxID=2978973 RepID=UPI0025B52E78|nr:ATP-binding cassette domain-containing protein [Fontisubflavum oceani]WJY21120.1 ATP-binding cassette domain-containing protein [Fontisubflavum oceani]
MTTVLELRDLKTSFFTGDGELRALHGISLSVARGEILGLVGESGSGKSLTGFSINGLISPPGRVVGGEVRVHGEDLLQVGPEEMRQARGRKIAMIFQDPMMTLNPVLRIETQMRDVLAAHLRLSRSGSAGPCDRRA